MYKTKHRSARFFPLHLRYIDVVLSLNKLRLWVPMPKIYPPKKYNKLEIKDSTDPMKLAFCPIYRDGWKRKTHD